MSHDVFDAAGFGARSGHAREALSEPLLNATAAAELLSAPGENWATCAG
jgi:hypothetical protein